MAEYKDIDEILKKLPDDLPYKASVKRVLMQAPAADVVPRAEVEDLIRENESLAKTVIKSSELIRKLRSKLEKYRSVVERDIVIVGRRQGKEAEMREAFRYRTDLIREAAVKEFAESLLEGRVGNDPVSVAVRVGLKSFLEEEGEK